MSRTPTDNIVNQLTNIGGSYKTPLQSQTSNNSTQSPKSKQNTPSKRWAEKFMKFQRHGSKKKGSTPSTPFTISPMIKSSSSHSPDASRRITTPSQPHHPSRTSSLPRPNSQLFTVGNRTPSSISYGNYTQDSVKHTSPPRVIPFGYPKPLASAKKSFLNASCTLCEELISNRSNGERIIELECGHLSHQECLLVSFGNTSTSSDLYSMFPQCVKCKEERHSYIKCIPKNDALKDKLISDVLIYSSTTTSSPIIQQQQTPISSGNYSPITSAQNHLEGQSLFNITPIAPTNNHLYPLDESRSGIILPQTAHHSYIKPNFQLSKPVKRRNPSVFGAASVISSSHASDILSFEEPSQNNRSNSMSQNHKVSVHLLRSYFLEILMNQFPKRLSGTNIDSKYGLLRLVDRLMISTDNGQYRKCWCYLFQNAILIGYTNDDNNESDENIMLTTRFTELEIFYPIKKVQVEPVDSSVLKCSLEILNDCKIFYLTETINSDSSMIAQKWISALLDLDLIFDQLNFTSTLPLPPIIQNISEDNEDIGTFTGLININKVVEITSMANSNESIIIRKGITLPPDTLGGNALDTIQTAMTSISSIISLKRERPDDLVIVLQINLKKIRNDEEFHIIFNSLKALTMKFPSLYFCAVDSELNVISEGLVNDKITEPESIKHIARQQQISEFKPATLKNILYPNDIHKNVGIVVISNADMEEKTSCLFLDYSCFKSVERRRVNELKVKVGYLNIDYSDKVRELVEINSWSALLEALCYSFTINFDEDDEDEYSLQENESISFETGISEGNSDTDSMRTLNISSQIVKDTSMNSVKGSDLLPSLSSHVIGTRHENSNTDVNPQGPKYTAVYMEDTEIRKGNWDPPLNDIDKKVKNFSFKEEVSSIENDDSSSNAEAYNYL